jgi:very-short-patch-repair endonuclease
MRASIRTILFAKGMREDQTLPERMLWYRLRQLRAQGVHFRRQHPIGPFIVDFYCAKARLAVEVDGMVHRMADNPQRDERRDAWLNARGVWVYRIEAAEVLRDPDGVANSIFWTAGAGPLGQG